MCETEDVVDKQQYVAAFTFGSVVTETLGYGKTAQGYTGTCTGWFVHLSVHHGGLALLQFLLVDQRQVPLPFLHGFLEGLSVADDTTFYHLAQQVVALARSFAHSREYTVSVSALGHVVDELHNEHGLPHTGTSEETNLSALGIGFQQVDDLDSGGQYLACRLQLVKLGRLPVDGQCPFLAQRLHAVYWLTDYVHQPSFHLVARGHGNGFSRSMCLHAPAQSVGAVHGNAAYGVLADVLLHLQRQPLPSFPDHFQCFVDMGQLETACLGRLKPDVHHWADNL